MEKKKRKETKVAASINRMRAEKAERFRKMHESFMQVELAREAAKLGKLEFIVISGK